MPVFVIFVEGADTEPAKVPVYGVDSEEHAILLCEGMKESDYAIFDFSFKHCTRSDRGKFAVWATMIDDARKGVYGNIVGGIHNVIDRAYSIMSGRRLRDKVASAPDTDTSNAGSPTPTGQVQPVTGSETPVDVLSTIEIAKLLGIGRDRLNNVLSEERPQAKPVKGGGRRPDAYSYAAIQPWLRKHWPEKAALLSDSFDDVQRILRDKKANE
jgi:hypothetical protein